MKIKYLILLLVLGVLFRVAAQKVNAISFYTMYWTAWYQNDEGQSYPLAGARVNLRDVTTGLEIPMGLTNASGMWTINGINNHQYQYEFRAPISNIQVCWPGQNTTGKVTYRWPVHVHVNSTFHCHMQPGTSF